ncbi:hypothetical protein JCM18899A_36180 [Nocardioides sp. AN3]
MGEFVGHSAAFAEANLVHPDGDAGAIDLRNDESGMATGSKLVRECFAQTDKPFPVGQPGGGRLVVLKTVRPDRTDLRDHHGDCRILDAYCRRDISRRGSGRWRRVSNGAGHLLARRVRHVDHSRVIEYAKVIGARITMEDDADSDQSADDEDADDADHDRQCARWTQLRSRRERWRARRIPSAKGHERSMTDYSSSQDGEAEL